MLTTLAAKLHHCRTAWVVLGTALWVVTGAAVGAENAAPREITPAILKDQEIVFTYRSSSTVYSCSALEGRVESLLRAVGADPGLKVSTSGCSEFFVPTPDPFTTGRNRNDRFGNFGSLNGAGRQPQFATVRIQVRSPIEATPEALAELEKTRPFRELLGRVTGSSAPIQEAAAQFPARRQEITLGYRSLRLEPEECELLEQMMTDVFPKLGVRVVKRNGLACNPRQQSLIRPRVVVEALVRTPLEETPGAKPEEPAEAAPAAATDAP